MTKAPSDRESRSRAPRPEPDREAIADFRALADGAELFSACPQPVCRRARRCRGALMQPQFFGEDPLPFCLAIALDDIAEPIVRGHAFARQLGEAADKLMAQSKAPGARRRG